MPDNKKAIGKRRKNNLSNLPKGTNFLLTIGIDDYVHCPKLNNAVKDTRDIANVLLEKYEFEAIHHLKLENKEATKDNIIELFREIKNKATEKDNVLIYYSGHGKLNEDEESFWIPVDARENKEGDFISVDKLFRLLKVIKSHHILLILDSCFSGSMLSANTSRSLNKNEIQPSRYGIASGRRELVSDGQPGHNSPFADSLIKKLTINSESLGASDLAQQVMHLTRTATNQNQIPLHGRMVMQGDKLGEFFFHLKKENTNNTFSKNENKEEEELWEKTILENSIIAFDTYLEHFPNGKYADEAEQRMEEIEQEEMWMKTKRNNSIVSYRKYLRRYSKGKYRTEAQTAIEKLKSRKEDIVELKEESPNTFTDLRDGQTYKTVELDGNIWMAENFNFDAGEQCWNFNNDPENGKKYGRLYTWDAAIKACPKGWRLPSDEEWSKILKQYKGYAEGLGNEGKPIRSGLVKQNILRKMNLLLGGLRDKDIGFSQLEESGCYWSAKEHYKTGAFFYELSKKYGVLERGKEFKTNALSCRYIKISKEEKSVKKKHAEIIQPTKHISKDPNLFTDPRDGQTYKIAQLIDGNIWMTQNFNFDAGKDCWHFDNTPKNGEQYGRLYTWDAAQKACPEGWHIPTDEEWWNLANHYDSPYNEAEGRPRNDDYSAGSAAYQALVKGGSSPLEIVLSGLKMIDGDFAGLGKFGNYWSSTNSFDVHFFYYNFSGNAMRRGVHPKRIANSCRCVKDK